MNTVPTPSGGEQRLPHRTHDLGYRVEVREHKPDHPEAVGRLVAVAAPDHENRWTARHRDGRSHPTSQAMAAVDLWALVTEPVAQAGGAGVDPDAYHGRDYAPLHGAFPVGGPRNGIAGDLAQCAECGRLIEWVDRTPTPERPWPYGGWRHVPQAATEVVDDLDATQELGRVPVTPQQAGQAAHEPHPDPEQGGGEQS